MSEHELNQYEGFLLNSKDSVVSKTIKGTDSYYYFQFIKLLNDENFNLNEDQRKQLQDYSKFETDRAKDIKLRHLFLQYDQFLKEGKEEDKKNILGQLNKILFQYTFDHAQPSEVQTSNTLTGETKEVISKLDQSIIDIQKFYDKAYTCRDSFNQLDQTLLGQLDLSRLSSSPLEVQEAFLTRIGPELISFKGVPEFIKNYFDTGRLKNKDFQLSSFIFGEISLTQMGELLKLLPDLNTNADFIGELYIKKFTDHSKGTNYEFQSQVDKEERKKTLKEIYQWTLTLPPLFESFSDQILYELLQIGIDTNNYDFDLFLTYLKNPKQSYGFANERQAQKLKERKRVYQTQWYSYHALNTSRWLKDDDLITKYLEKYFETSEDYQLFEQYLDKKYLVKILNQVKLYKGQEVADITKIFDGSTLKTMNEQKLISICPFNKKFFTHGESVKLYVEIKNIPNLTIKIFEFCTENYLLKNQNTIDDSINLDGLIASEQNDFINSEPPIVKQLKEFTFENITKKQRGVFIIEFIGNGITSRAIIKKGRLTLKEKLTVAGHVYQILDENLEVCNGTRTGIWINGRFYQVNKDNEIIVPFVTSEQTHQVVIVHEDFAYIGSVQLLQESYDFRCSFLYSTESMLMSSKAKVLIQPKLYVKSVPASFKLLSEPLITITTRNEHDIPSTMTFDKIKFDYNEEVEVEFPIAAKLKTIDIIVTAKVEKLHTSQDTQQETKQDNKQTVSQSHQIIFQNYTGVRVFCSQYLRFTQDNGYEIYVLGKNGEPKQGVDLKLQFYLIGQHQINATLTTDDQGRVILGALKDVVRVESSVRVQGDISTSQDKWDLGNRFRVNYPEQVNLVLGDTYRIPFLAQAVNQKTLSLFSFYNNPKSGTKSVIKDLINNVKLENGALIVKDLDVGQYYLLIKSPFKVIQIQVFQGRYWKNTQLIITQGLLFDAQRDDNQLVLISQQTTQNAESTTIQANFYSNNPEGTRVHAFAVSFLPNTLDNMAQNITNQILNQQNKKIQIDLPQNAYYSNKRLSDEQKYVLDRKNQERYVGNTLEKPQFLLKRQFIRETSNTTEQIQPEGQFQMSQQDQFNREFACLQQIQNRSHMLCQISSGGANQNNQVNSFLNFLKYPAAVIGNKKLEADGSVVFQIPNKQYQTVFLVATNNSNVVLEVVPLKSIKFQTRDLTQKSALNQDKYYSIFRSQSQSDKDGLIQVPDLTSTEIQIVDSVAKMFSLLKELRKCNGPDNEQEQGIEFWEFLKRWNRLDFDEKHKLFDKYQCDELNLFIFFKDRAYFDTYVQQYIANKIEQTFVDHFLNLNRQKLLNYSNASNLKGLNTLEQVLLVIYFCELSGQVEDIQIAKDLVQYLDSLNKLKVVDQREYKRLFDTVLEAKTSEGHSTLTQSLTGGVSQASISNSMPSQMFAAQLFPAPQMMMRLSVSPAAGMRKMKMAVKQQYGVKKEESINLDSMDYDDQILQEDKYVQARKQFQQDFKNLEKTKEYAEKHYFSTKSIEEQLHLVQLNGFWIDLAKHSLEHGVFSKPFLSSKFIYCNKNHTQMILVLALMNLPYESANHKYTPFEGKGVIIQAASSALVFTKEIKEGKADLKLDILAAQRFFDPKDRYVYSEEDSSVKIEKDISEYIVNKVYGCQVIVTNCSVTRYDFQVLVEVPSGSIPVETVDYTKNHNITLDPYTTKTIEFFFYFPAAGTYEVYPANVARFGNVVAVAKSTVFKVNNELTKTNLETMSDILSKGSKSDILNFVTVKNISNPNVFNFNDIYYLLKDKTFYLSLLDILRKKRVYDETTWTFSLFHADHKSLQEFFSTREILANMNQFKYFKCSLFEKVSVRLLEYYPLVAQRVHQLSQDRSGILNVEFKQQYVNFIHYLVEKNNHTLSDKLVFIYYLLLQERINEAIQIFKTIDQTKLPESGEARLQFDYFTAYLDFYIGFPNFIRAREVCEKYLDCPAIHWRNLFIEIVNQLTEYDGEDDQEKTQKIQSDDTSKKNQANAEKEQVLQLTLENYHLTLTHLNITEVTVQIYKIDLEVLFSRNPFISQGNEDFAYVQPNHIFTVKLSNQQSQAVANKTVVDIPEKFRKDNIFVQISSGDKRVQTTYFSTSLQVQVLDNYGQVKVQDQNGKYLSKIYIKTYAKENNGNVIFYKDGYTDLRGRFDYASTNSGSLNNVEKFAIFVMSDELGSLIKEVKAPSQVGKYEVEVKLISKSWEDKQSKKRTSNMKSYAQRDQQYHNEKK